MLLGATCHQRLTSYLMCGRGSRLRRPLGVHRARGLSARNEFVALAAPRATSKMRTQGDHVFVLIAHEGCAPLSIAVACRSRFAARNGVQRVCVIARIVAPGQNVAEAAVVAARHQGTQSQLQVP